MSDGPLGWLAPDGTFCPCGWGSHVTMAESICKQRGFSFSSKSADDVLMEHGYVHLTQSFLTGEYSFFWDRLLTTMQIAVLKPYFENSDLPISKSTQMEWEFETREV